MKDNLSKLQAMLFIHTRAEMARKRLEQVAPTDIKLNI